MIDIRLGNAIDVLSTVQSGAVKTCVTSPPYLWQRRYIRDDDPRVELEIGREPEFKTYIASLVAVFGEVRRVLSADGTLWVNIGDLHANDTKWGGVTGGKHQKHLHGDPGLLRQKRKTGLPPKCLMGLPWRFAIAMIDAGWTLRCDVVWEKTNAMPEGNIRDRPTIAHEYVFLFSKGPKYYYNANAISDECREQSTKRRNARSVWRIQTDKGAGDHVAPMPRALARRCIMAGSAPNDLVLDPFGGSGTVGVVAAQEGRRALLIDIDEKSVALMRAKTCQLGLVSQ